MKHRHLFGTAALLLCGLSVCLAVCGGAGTKVDAETWSAAFDNLNNYTISGTTDSGGASFVNGDSVVKLADGWLMSDTSSQPNGSKNIVSSTSDEYYIYPYTGYEWEKMNDGTGKEVYETATMVYNMIFSLFKESYDKFTFTDGQYICESLIMNRKIMDTEISVHVQNISISFEGDGLKELMFEIVASTGSSSEAKSSMKITEFGTTTIEFPTEFVDKTTKK